MRYWKAISIALIGGAVAVGCEGAAGEERWEGPLTTEEGRNVLIEDFTGQRCVNCPLAHEEIKALERTYGKERIVAVAIHGGAQAIGEDNEHVRGLATAEGEKMNERWGNFGYPKGWIEREGGLLDVEQWRAAVVKAMAVKAGATMQIEMEQRGEDEWRTRVSVKAENELKGRLVLWLVENGIEAYQELPKAQGGGYDRKYVHDHVFRRTIGKAEGEPLRLAKGEEGQQVYDWEVKGDERAEHLEVVAWVEYEHGGVAQVMRKRLCKRCGE